MPLELQNFSWWTALALFAGFGGLVVFLGLWSLSGLGKVRQWTAIGIRLMVVALLLLILGGARYQRKHEGLEVMILDDASLSVSDFVSEFPGRGKDVATVRQALDRYFHALSEDPTKETKDTIGLVSFGKYARVDAMPSYTLRLDARGAWDKGANGTDISAAIQFGLATMSPDSMHRLLLVSDGNENMGDINTAIDAARAQNVPIDVAMLKYDVKNDVMVSHLIAPEWQREDEPFNVQVELNSTNSVPVSGTLKVQHLTADGEAYLDMDPTTPQLDVGRRVTLEPGKNVQTVRVPPQAASGVHRFRATFIPDDPVAGAKVQTIDSVGANDQAEAFTFVRGEGKILFVDGTAMPGQNQAYGDRLFDTLYKELTPKVLPGGKEKKYEPLRKITVGEFPRTLADLQSYNAVILYNVAKGGDSEGGFVSGLDGAQDALLKSYVYDVGGGLLMIGGPNSFGAGGWTGSETEKILPVDMEIPAQRNVGKGALVLVMHSCEMPQGNFWGEQCAIEAVKTLSVRDDVGIISYGWGQNNNQGIGGAQWDRPLGPVKDKSNVIDAIKRMQLGDMPSFDDAINLALNGAGGTAGLRASTARNKHIIVISDGDPTAPQQGLIQACQANKISISTVTVYPHVPGSARPQAMDQMAKDTQGKAYGPIETKPDQLPQIFIKEAQIVKRSLIQESDTGLPLNHVDRGDEVIASISSFPPVFGMVLTSRKNDPKVMMPISTGSMKDPILAYWQSGLGKAAVWTSDAHGVWDANWISTPGYTTLFGQIVRKIQRPMQNSDFTVRTRIEGDKGTITVEALEHQDASFASFLSMTANVIGGQDLSNPQQIRFVQDGPGHYTGTFRAVDAGPYVAAVNWSRGEKDSGLLMTGQVKNGGPESQNLKSNEALLQQIAERTNGRVLPAFDAAGAELFTRKGITPGYSLMQIWDQLLPWLLALIILDVAVRRIAWDWQSIRRMAATTADRVRGFTVLRQVEGKETMEALRKKREEVATGLKQEDQPGGALSSDTGKAAPQPGARPDPKAKFTAKAGVEGDITQVVGGATNKPLPSAPKAGPAKGDAAGGPADHIGGLMAAKKRAQREIKDKEQGGGKSPPGGPS